MAASSVYGDANAFIENLRDFLTAMTVLQFSVANDLPAPVDSRADIDRSLASLTPTQKDILILMLASSWAKYLSEDPNVLHPESMIDDLIQLVRDEIDNRA